MNPSPGHLLTKAYSIVSNLQRVLDSFLKHSSKTYFLQMDEKNWLEQGVFRGVWYIWMFLRVIPFTLLTLVHSRASRWTVTDGGL